MQFKAAKQHNNNQAMLKASKVFNVIRPQSKPLQCINVRLGSIQVHLSNQDFTNIMADALVTCVRADLHDRMSGGLHHHVVLKAGFDLSQFNTHYIAQHGLQPSGAIIVAPATGIVQTKHIVQIVEPYCHLNANKLTEQLAHLFQVLKHDLHCNSVVIPPLFARTVPHSVVAQALKPIVQQSEIHLVHLCAAGVTAFEAYAAAFQQ